MFLCRHGWVHTRWTKLTQSQLHARKRPVNLSTNLPSSSNLGSSMYGSVPPPGIGRVDKVGLRVDVGPTRPTCQTRLLVPSAGVDAGMGAAPGGKELVVEMDEVVEVFEAGGKY